MRRARMMSLKALSFAALSSPFVLSACVSAPSRPHPAPNVEDPAAVAPSVVAEAPAAPAVTTETVTPPPPVDQVVPPPPPVTPVAPVPMRVRPISGGTLKILSDGRTAVAADADRDRISVVDLVDGRVTSTIALQNGDEPGRVVEDGSGLVHVALRGGGAIASIDPKAGALLARRELCAAPRGLAYQASTDELHVACAGGELVTIGAAPTATTPLRTLKMDRDLRDVVPTNDGRLMVSTFRSATVFVIDGQGNVSSPRGVGTDNRGRTPGVAWRLVGTPDGSSAYMLHELAQPQALGTFPGAYQSKSNCGAVVSSTVTVVAPDAVSFQAAAPFTSSLVAADVAIAPGGTQMAVVSIASSDPSDVVQFFNVGEASGTAINNFFDGCWHSTPAAPPVDVDANATSDGLPAPAPFLPPSGQVVAVAYDSRGNVIVQSREPASLQILTQRREPVVLSDESRFDLGHQVFHTATSGQIACVSCHPEGGEDGRVWTFQGLGPRRTQSLRGGIMDTAPFHWGGDEPSMTSLMKDVFQGRMGGAEVDGQRVTALGQWIDQIPTVRVSPAADQSPIARGATLFQSAGCASCHSGADFTNGQTVDVGTGGAFQVPQLHGLALRAPYMHNGCAQTLHDRFSTGCGGSDKHAVGMFSNAQVDDLVAYLETL